MKVGFIRGLWGIYDKAHRITNRRYKIDNDIQNILNNPFNEKFVTYVMGTDNYNQLLKTDIEKKGYEVKEVCSEPYLFDIIPYMYRNKIEIIKYAFEKDGYDKLVYLDWDCVPQKPLPDDFWKVMEGKVISGCLQCYKHLKSPWRKEYIDKRKVMNGGWMYIADKEIPAKVAKIWEEIGKGDNDEPAFAKYIDNLTGGWKGDDYFWDNFETPFCNLHRMSVYQAEKRRTKNQCFLHFQG